MATEPSWPMLTRSFGQMAEDLLRARAHTRDRRVQRAAVLEGLGGIRVLVTGARLPQPAVYSFSDGVLHQTGETWEALPIFCEQQRPAQGWSYVADLRED
jgi:hypothetical protein